MSDDVVRSVNVPGIRYRAIPVYSDAGELDELARFFYEQVLKVERRIDHLREIFGLPARVVEDVLAELIRKNYALLDVASKEVVPIPNARPQRKFTEYRPKDFWQDRITGTVIHYEDIPFTYRQPAGARRPVSDQVIVLQEAGPVSQFEDLPSARIVGMLRATSPDVVVLRSGERLESLLARHKISQASLTLPMSRITIDQSAVDYIDAPGFPVWLTRAWTQRANSVRAAEDRPVAISLAAREPSQLPDASAVAPRPSFLESCSIRWHVRRWHQSLTEMATQTTVVGLHSRQKQYDVDRDALLDLLEGVVAIDLTTATGASHLEEMWHNARDYMLIAMRSPRKGTVDSFVRALGDPTSWERPLVVVMRAEDAKHTSQWLPSAAPVDALRRVEVPLDICAGACFSGTGEVRFGTLDELFGNEATLRVKGRVFARDLLAGLTQFFPSEKTDWYTQDLVLVQADAPHQDLRKLVDDEPLASQWAPEALRTLVREMDGLVFVALDRAKEVWDRYDQTVVADDEDTELQAQRKKQVETLRELEPRLVRLEAELEEWEHDRRLAQPLASVHLEPTADAIGACSHVFAYLAKGRQRELLMICDSAPEQLLSQDFTQGLKSVLAAGNDVTVYLNPIDSTGTEYDEPSVSILQRLAKAVPHDRLVLARGARRLPVAMVVDAELVVVGAQTWFTTVQGHHWIFVVDAPHLGKQLVELGENARSF